MTICHQQESAMRKSRLGMFAMLVIAMCTTACVAQEKKPLSPPGQASVKFDDGKTVTIQYGRPSMRGRKIFGGLVPYDQVWRAGANSATSPPDLFRMTRSGAPGRTQQPVSRPTLT